MLSSAIGGEECVCLHDRRNNDFRRDALGLRVFPKVIVVVNECKRASRKKKGSI